MSAGMVISAVVLAAVVSSALRGRTPFAPWVLWVGFSVAALVPIREGSSVAAYLIGINPSWSVGSVALCAAWIYGAFTSNEAIARRELIGYYVFVLALGLWLYAGHLFTYGPDLYSQGYASGWGVWLIGAAGAAFALAGSRAAYIVLASLAAYALKLMPSDNAFDYVMDAPLWMFSICALAWALMKKKRSTRWRS